MHANTAARRGAARPMPHHVDIKAVAAIALASSRTLLRLWFPLGRFSGDNFAIGNIQGERGGSLSITLSNGCWLDFANPALHGGDLVALNAARLRVSQVEAAHDICAALGIDPPLRPWDGQRRHSAPRLVAPPPPPAPQPIRNAEPSRLWAHIWAERCALRDSVAALYLLNRRLTAPDLLDIADLAFHPACPRRGDRVPAMLALMRDPATGEPCGVHRTFLRPDATKDCGPDGELSPKMMLGKAGVITLTPAEEVTTGLGIAEGIENALTLMVWGMRPVWACGTANGIAKLPVLPGVEEIRIFGDRGDAGLAAVRDCAERWSAAGRGVTIHLPKRGAGDWNHILMWGGAA